MDNFNVRRNFSEYTDTELIDRASNVVEQMSGNTNFTTPEPPLADITTAKNNFSTAYFQVYNGNLTFMPDKRLTRSILISLLTREAKYVEFTGQNVETVLSTSGFEIYNTSTAVAPASEVPVIEKGIDTGIVGTSKIKIQKVEHAVVYELRYTRDEIPTATSWIYLVCQTKTIFEVTNLVPGIEYWFEVRSISTKGPSGWSDPFRFRSR